VVVAGDLQLIPVLQLPNAMEAPGNRQPSHGTPLPTQVTVVPVVKQFGQITNAVELVWKQPW
jgi:hypothetical protein